MTVFYLYVTYEWILWQCVISNKLITYYVLIIPIGSTDNNWRPGTANQSFTSLKIEMKDQPPSLIATFSQHVEFASSCWLSKPKLTATNHYLPKFLSMTLHCHWCHILTENPSPIGDRTSVVSRSTISKHYALNRVTIAPYNVLCTDNVAKSV